MIFMDFITFLLFVISILWICTFTLISNSRARRASKLPPGPYQLPVIGNILQLGSKPHRSLTNLSKKYGPLMSLKLGSLTTVVVSSADVAKIVFQKHDLDFSSRSVPSSVHHVKHDEFSVAWLPVDNQWRKLRKICKEQMFSFSRLDASQGLRKEKLQKLCDYIKDCSDTGRAVDIGEAAFTTSLNLMSATLFSMEFAPFNSDSSQEMKDVVWGGTLSSKISECCPTFCTVYAVCKGKLSSLRPSDSEETNQSLGDNSSDSSCSIENTSSQSFSSQSDWTDQGSTSHFHSASLPMQRFQALSNINQTLLHRRMPSTGVTYPINLSLDYAERSKRTNIVPSGSDVKDTNGRASSFASSVADDPSWDQASASETSTKNQANVNFELEKLRTELRHIRGMYAMAQSEATDTSRKLNELEKRHVEEEMNLKQISLKEEEAKELARREKKRYEAAKRDAELVKDCAEREAMERKEAELIVSRKKKENENLESVLNGCFNQYRQFTWEEIVFATSSFSDNLKIGIGAYGTVYKCSFQHTTAAVKVLHAKEESITKQFQQELEILSQIRHPHLLILLGACPERSCLVYELMENGSLQDTLSRKNNTPPLIWFDRVRIAWEVASALVSLHNTKPNPIIHRDLKPANILLDRNNVSKIGDVGLSTIINMDSLSMSMMYKDTSPVGTLCYIDPEYQRTGVVSPKSDVYAFGMVILQLVTGKPAIALAHKVETAMESDCLMEVLDPEADGWPIEEAKDLALVGLKCTELRQKDRPDLENEVLPVLEKLKDSAEKARYLALVSSPPPPKYFTCPILNEVMTDPCVAADGYTYERRAIEAWLKERDTSPMTMLQLPHKYLIPNYALLSAIIEWQSRKQT